MNIITEMFQKLAAAIEASAQLERQQQRILQGQCIYCCKKLPMNSPSYHCNPDCRTELAAPCVFCGVKTNRQDVYENFCCEQCEAAQA